MGLFFPLFRRLEPTNKSIASLVFCWVCGCVAGTLFSFYCMPVFPKMIMDATAELPSLYASITASTFPLFFTAAAFFSSCPQLIFPIIFLTAFNQCFLSFAVYLAYHSAGWLICLLFHFGSIASAPLLWLCWFSSVTPQRMDRFKFAAIFFICFFIGMTDYFLVSPFLQEIIF